MASHRLGAAAVLAGLAMFSSGAGAQQFELIETPSVTQLPVAQLKPKSIVFSDQPGEGLVDPAVGFVTYEAWAKAKPVEAQFLGLYPGYGEPNFDVIVDGTKRRYRERLHMYVAEARFIVGAARRRRSISRSLRRLRSPSGSTPPSSTGWRRPPTRPVRGSRGSSITSTPRSGNGARAGRW